MNSLVGGGYPVRVGAGILDELPSMVSRLAPAYAYGLIADDTVFQLHGERVVAALEAIGRPVFAYTFPSGEARKNRTEWSRLTDALLADGLGRDGCVVALGGGVAGDLAGFVAATYMRGVPVVQIPTSLVAMVDSSVGGKTGVDVPSGKNLVGAFHPPRLVLADTELAATLPRSERSQGLAEAVKHGAILDSEYFDWIARHAGELLAGEPGPTGLLVARSVQLKAAVVGEDEKEADLRQILNFGHTLGHALEAASGYSLPHGSAVALGMVLEAKLGEQVGVTREGVASSLVTALQRVELPAVLSETVDPDDLLDLVSRDKKARGGRAKYVLLSKLGTVDPGKGWSHALDPANVRRFLERIG
ncbi:MAG: 3-dehydroquinate synthase [Gemmatimonadota bacterium]